MSLAPKISRAMRSRWCVCGLLVHDSGKTWLTISLVKALRDRGIASKPLKPVAGHSAWIQRKTLDYSARLGILVGEDVYQYYTMLNLNKDELPLVNPVDLLLAPPNPTSYIRDGRLRLYASLLESSLGQIALARLPGSSLEPQHYLISDVVEMLTRSVKERILDLARELNAESIELNELVRLLKSKSIEDKVLECIDRVSKDVDVAVIESFNDAVVPLLKLLNRIDLLLLVAPSIVAVYRDIDSVKRSIEIEIALRGEEALRTPFALSRARPIAIEEVEFSDDTSSLSRSRSLNHLLDSLLALQQSVGEPL